MTVKFVRSVRNDSEFYLAVRDDKVNLTCHLERFKQYLRCHLERRADESFALVYDDFTN